MVVGDLDFMDCTNDTNDITLDEASDELYETIRQWTNGARDRTSTGDRPMDQSDPALQSTEHVIGQNDTTQKLRRPSGASQTQMSMVPKDETTLFLTTPPHEKQSPHSHHETAGVDAMTVAHLVTCLAHHLEQTMVYLDQSISIYISIDRYLFIDR